MEAVTKLEFTANANHLLSFKKGEVLQILFLDENESQGWYKAQLNGKEGLVSRNMVDLHFAPWFRGVLGRSNAEGFLIKSFMHKFIIRQSQTRWFLSLKAEDGKVWHFQIQRGVDTKFNFFCDFTGKRMFQSLNQIAAFIKRSGWYSAPWWSPHLALMEDPLDFDPSFSEQSTKFTQNKS